MVVTRKSVTGKRGMKSGALMGTKIGAGSSDCFWTVVQLKTIDYVLRS